MDNIVYIVLAKSNQCDHYILESDCPCEAGDLVGFEGIALTVMKSCAVDKTSTIYEIIALVNGVLPVDKVYSCIWEREKKEEENND